MFERVKDTNIESRSTAAPSKKEEGQPLCLFSLCATLLDLYAAQC